MSSLGDELVKMLLTASSPHQQLNGRNYHRVIAHSIAQSPNEVLRLIRTVIKREISPKAKVVNCEHLKGCTMTIGYDWDGSGKNTIVIGFGEDGKFVTQNEP